MKLKPLHNKLIVKPQKAEEVSKGGIFIPESAADKPMEGTVLAVGPGKYDQGDLIPVGVEVGDHVLYGKYAGQEVKIDDETVLIMDGDEIIAILEK